MLLHFEVRALDRRLGSKSKANFVLFDPLPAIKLVEG